MSVDEYALQLAQKYRLAISIAILKTKPQNLSIDEHIDQIKKNIETQDDDFNVSVCSDDFRMDDVFENQNNTSNILEVDGNNGISLDGGNDTVKNNDGSNDLAQKSITESNNEDDIEKNERRQTKFREMVDLLKSVDSMEEEDLMKDLNCGNQKQKFDMDLTQYEDYSTFFESVERCADKRYSNNTDGQYNDNKKHRDRISTKHNNDANNDITSQRDIKHVDRVDPVQKIGQKDISTKEIKVLKINFDKTSSKRQININNETPSKSKIAKVLTEIKDNTRAEKINDKVPLINDASNYSFNIASHKAQNIKPVVDTQNTEYTQFNTHYSESQIEMTIDRRYIHGIDNQKAKNTQEIQKDKDLVTQICLDESVGMTNENMFVYSQDAQNMDEYMNEFNSKSLENEGKNMRLVIKDSMFTQDSLIMDYYDNSNTNNIKDLTIDDDFSAKYIDKNVNITEEFDDANVIKDAHNRSKKQNSYMQLIKENTEHKMQANTKTHKDFEKTNNFNKENDEELTKIESETIPFKIMKEMNKVKIYLSRQDTLSDNLNTGYRSKSQSKCSFKNTQPSYMSLDQTATSLLNYITNCPLLNTTQKLTEQISEVLGQLIDRLHEEETYPTFLEQQLETINNMLQLIYEEENYVDDVYLKKDEQIQRIMLLNKSKHIQKFTIEKINEILQKLIEDFSKNDAVYEIQNINKLENLSFIFHVLNCILEKYCTDQNSSQCTQSTQNINTQSTQNYQEIRKSGISDIWRKKWIPNYKEHTNEGSFENKCVIKSCCTLLNKIIVDFMDEYSLIAYAALKCFNLIQTL